MDYYWDLEEKEVAASLWEPRCLPRNRMIIPIHPLHQRDFREAAWN